MAKLNTVKYTGAKAGDILVNRYEANRGLRVKVYSNQKKVGTRIEGPFKLLDAGVGVYAEAMSEFKGRRFENAESLIDLIKAKPGGENANSY